MTELQGREFQLVKVQDRFEGKTYQTLEQEEKLRLDDSIIHATIIKQEEPSDDQSSIFHVFERLNTGGMQLQAQEIRASIFHGPFNDLLRDLNGYKPWRGIFGKRHARLKENALRIMLSDYAADKSHANVARYAQGQIERITNLNEEKLKQLLGAFSEKWARSFQRTITDEQKLAIDSIVANRHNIAHGRSVGITIASIKEYYERTAEVVEWIRRNCIET